METQSGSTETILREDLSRAYETIRAYELMLHATADTDTGHASSTGGLLLDSTRGVGAGGSKDTIPLPVTVLASDPRRLRLLLDTSERNAKKLSDQDHVIADLQQQVQSLQGALDDAQEREAMLRRVMEASKHPPQYAIVRLQEKEQECLSVRKECAALRSRGEGLEEAVRTEREEGDKLRLRLHQLLEQRAEIEDLRALLQTVCVYDEAAEDENYSSDDDGGADGSGDFDEFESPARPTKEEPSTHDNRDDDLSYTYSFDENTAIAETTPHRPDPHSPAHTAPPSSPVVPAVSPVSPSGRSGPSTPTKLRNDSSPEQQGTPLARGSTTTAAAAMSSLSPAAMRAMTERNKGYGPSRIRFVDAENSPQSARKPI